MENTLENKAKFFALYWGQKTVRNTLFNFTDTIEVSSASFSIEALPHLFLELKPLSSISDEDFNEVMCLIFPFQPRASFKNSGFYTDHLNINQSDYLRSKGYALPWMGLSVESLIEYGWVKLNEPNNA